MMFPHMRGDSDLIGLGLLFCLYLPVYPNGTGNGLKIRRLNCLWVRLPLPVPMPV